jgi:PadR family transcriptional regulator PadR
MFFHGSCSPIDLFYVALPYIKASSRLVGIEMHSSRQNQRGCDRQLTGVAAIFFLTSRLSLVYSMPVANKPMTETTSRDLFPGALEMMILESLRRQPSHGYALVQQIQQLSKNLLQVEEGSLYPALQRLLKAKLVEAQWGVSPANRRVRTYNITTAGLRRLDEQISSFERMFEGIALVLNPSKATAN